MKTTLTSCLIIALTWALLYLAADYAVDRYWQEVAGCSCKDCIKVYLAGGPENYWGVQAPIK